MKFKINRELMAAKKMTVVALKARPEPTMNGQGIIDWYTNHGYLADFLEQVADGKGEMTYNNTTNLYEISFMPSERWPKTFQGQTDDANIYLQNPDDDGNYPINGYNVEAEIVSSNGQAVE